MFHGAPDVLVTTSCVLASRCRVEGRVPGTIGFVVNQATRFDPLWRWESKEG